VRAKEVEDAIVGQVCSNKFFEQAARKVSEVVDAESDVHVTDEYRGNVAEVLTIRALADALGRAKAAS